MSRPERGPVSVATAADPTGGMDLDAALRREAKLGVFRAGSLLAKSVPRSIAEPLATRIGRASVGVAPDKRRVVERNLRRVVGTNLSSAELARLVDATFASYGRYYYDSFRLPAMPISRVAAGFSIEGIEHLEEAMSSAPPGPVLALPHLGGWEWAARWVTGVRGWGLTAVVEPLDDGLFEWFRDLRRSLGMEIVPLGPDVMTELVRAARRSDILCLLSDRDITGTGIEVTFFGERTTLPVGPALLALRLGSPILPAAVYFQEGRDGVHGVIRPPLDISRTPGAPLRADIERITADLAAELEVLIRRAPQQWHLMQPNWPSDLEALR